MNKQTFNQLDLSSTAKRKQYPSTTIALEVLAYKNKRLDYWFATECECPYTNAARDVETKYGHLIQVK